MMLRWILRLLNDRASKLRYAIGVGFAMQALRLVAEDERGGWILDAVSWAAVVVLLAVIGLYPSGYDIPEFKPLHVFMRGARPPLLLALLGLAAALWLFWVLVHYRGTTARRP